MTSRNKYIIKLCEINCGTAKTSGHCYIIYNYTPMHDVGNHYLTLNITLGIVIFVIIYSWYFQINNTFIQHCAVKVF